MKDLTIFDPLGELKKIAEKVEIQKEEEGGKTDGVQARTDHVPQLRQNLP